MLKMKIDPTMCMKTQESRPNCHAKNTPFCRKTRQLGVFCKNHAGFLAEKYELRHQMAAGGRKFTGRTACLLSPFFSADVDASACRAYHSLPGSERKQEYHRLPPLGFESAWLGNPNNERTI